MVLNMSCFGRKRINVLLPFEHSVVAEHRLLFFFFFFFFNSGAFIKRNIKMRL